MKQILVDMDGVLADVYQHLIQYEYRRTGQLINIDDLQGKTEEDAFPDFRLSVNSKGFFRTIPLIEGSQEGLRYLNDNYKVLIVSSATEFPLSLTEKEEWLMEYFPFISWKQMIFCGDKSSIRGDIMLDDHPKNLNYFSGERYMFAQPHNLNSVVENCKRVQSWEDVLRQL